jgi:hypothetical protein
MTSITYQAPQYATCGEEALFKHGDKKQPLALLSKQLSRYHHAATRVRGNIAPNNY